MGGFCNPLLPAPPCPLTPRGIFPSLPPSYRTREWLSASAAHRPALERGQGSRDLAGTATCRSPMGTAGAPSGAFVQTGAGGTPHCHWDWASSGGLHQPTSHLNPPTCTCGVVLGKYCFLETSLLAVVAVFCAQGQTEPEIQGISKQCLHPIARSGSYCCNSGVKWTVHSKKIKQCFKLLPLKMIKSDV